MHKRNISEHFLASGEFVVNSKFVYATLLGLSFVFSNTTVYFFLRNIFVP